MEATNGILMLNKWKKFYCATNWKGVQKTERDKQNERERKRGGEWEGDGVQVRGTADNKPMAAN